MSTTAIVVFGIFLAGLLLAFFLHPAYGLLSYLWIFYNHPPMFWWGAELPDLRYALFAAMATFVAALRLQLPHATPWYGNAGAKLILLYAIWMWIQGLWAVDFDVHLEGAILCTKYVMLFYLIFKIVSDIKRIELFLWGHVGGSFLFGWLAYTTTTGGRLETIGGPGIDDANLLATHIITGLIAAGFMFIGIRGVRRWGAFLAIPFILNAIILTQSRGGFLALILAAPAAWYLSPKPYRRHIFLSGLLAAGLFVYLSHEEFWDRISTIFTSESQTIEETRLHLIGPQFEMFLDHPFGAGHRGNELLSPNYIPEQFLSETGRRSSHNTFMAALVDQGFPGAILLLGIYLWAGRALVRLKRLDEQGLPLIFGIYRAAIGTALMSCLISGLFLNLLKTEVQIWLVALLASLIAISHSAVQEANNASDTEHPDARGMDEAGEARPPRSPPD